MASPGASGSQRGGNSDSGLHFSSTQFAAGAAFGSLGGYMDSCYTEPFGLVLGSALAAIQLLDYGGKVRAPWNDDGGNRMRRTSLSDVPGALGDNVGAIAGFAVGYFVGLNWLDWMEGPSLDDVDAAGEGAGDASGTKGV